MQYCRQEGRGKKQEEAGEDKKGLAGWLVAPNGATGGGGGGDVSTFLLAGAAKIHFFYFLFYF